MDDEVKHYYRQVYPEKWKARVKEYGFTRYHQHILDLLPVHHAEPVLECGIGTGEPLALRLAQQGARVYGVDIARPLLDECERNFAAAGLTVHHV